MIFLKIQDIKTMNVNFFEDPGHQNHEYEISNHEYEQANREYE